MSISSHTRYPRAGIAHRQAAEGPKHFGTGRHIVDPSDSIQTTIAVTALVASAAAHRLQGGAPCLQGTDDVDAVVSGFAAAPRYSIPREEKSCYAKHSTSNNHARSLRS